ncbi:MAG: FkbM family methyltransferase [Actinomycetota bacterium]
MKLFLDVGAHVGETLEAVLDPRYGFDRIVCFEPTSECQTQLLGFDDTRVTVCPFGLWNETTERAIFAPGTLGASIFDRGHDLDEHEMARFVKASDWFRDNVAADDVVYVKLNCEGSECDILDDLIDSGEIRKVEEMVVHWDVRKIPSHAHREGEVRQRLRALGFRNALDAGWVMYGRTVEAKTHHWLHALGADTESTVLRRVRRFRMITVPRIARGLRGLVRRVTPDPAFRRLQKGWRRVRYRA